MKTRNTLALTASIALLAAQATAQSTLFDFNNLNQYSGLPVTTTVNGITATLSGTGQGFSIQSAGALGFTPAGFSGLCVYPNSIYAADLIIDFHNTYLTDFSIMYAPEEYACDSSATMRVTVYRNGSGVGTNTMIADPPGTWPTGVLAITSATPFNYAVVHYDKAPATGGDWGPVFLADNMVVTPSAAPPTLSGTVALGGTVAIPAGTPIAFTLYNGTTPVETQNTTLAADGTYSVAFANTGGTQIWAKPLNHLSYRQPGSLAPGANTFNWSFAIAGDADNSNAVNLLDLSTVLAYFGSTGAPGTLPGDLDYSGSVNLLDLSTVLANFGLTGQ